MQERTSQRGLTLHPTRTKIVNVDIDGFDFLGYRFIKHRRFPRRKSRKKFKDAIRFKTRRSNGRSLQAIISDLNVMLRGWYEYFKHSWIRNQGQTPRRGVADYLHCFRRRQQSRSQNRTCRGTLPFRSIPFAARNMIHRWWRRTNSSNPPLAIASGLRPERDNSLRSFVSVQRPYRFFPNAEPACE